MSLNRHKSLLTITNSITSRDVSSILRKTISSSSNLLTTSCNLRPRLQMKPSNGSKIYLKRWELCQLWKNCRWIKKEFRKWSYLRRTNKHEIPAQWNLRSWRIEVLRNFHPLRCWKRKSIHLKNRRQNSPYRLSGLWDSLRCSRSPSMTPLTTAATNVPRASSSDILNTCN